jgi:hypothetical protein
MAGSNPCGYPQLPDGTEENHVEPQNSGSVSRDSNRGFCVRWMDADMEFCFVQIMFCKNLTRHTVFFSGILLNSVVEPRTPAVAGVLLKWNR